MTNGQTRIDDSKYQFSATLGLSSLYPTPLAPSGRFTLTPVMSVCFSLLSGSFLPWRDSRWLLVSVVQMKLPSPLGWKRLRKAAFTLVASSAIRNMGVRFASLPSAMVFNALAPAAYMTILGCVTTHRREAQGYPLSRMSASSDEKSCPCHAQTRHDVKEIWSKRAAVAGSATRVFGVSAWNPSQAVVAGTIALDCDSWTP